MSWAGMKVLSLELSCDYCGAETNEACRTKSGVAARYTHWPRMWLVQKAWSLGYTEATADHTRSYVNQPEWFDRYARREVERASS